MRAGYPVALESENKMNEVGGRKFVALLVEDNRADALLIEEAIEAHALPIELHKVTDGERHLISSRRPRKILKRTVPSCCY